MTKAQDKRKRTVWYLVVASLIAVALTWYWFSQRISQIEEQIELHER